MKLKKLAALSLLTIILTMCFMAGCGKSSAPDEGGGSGGQSEDGNEKQKMFIVLRQAGDTYWETLGGGAIDWGKENNVDVTLVSPTDYDAAQQVAVLQDCITQKPDAILCCPISNEACEPVFKKAREQGIVIIVTEAMGMTNIDWDLEDTPNQKYAEIWMDELAKAMDEEGEYVMMVGSLQNTGHMARVQFAIDYQKEKYPNMKLVGDVVAPKSGTADASLSLFKELLATYPDLKGIGAHESVAQAALAIEEAGKTGKCFVAGYALPSEVHQYIENGTVAASIIADVPSAGASLASLASRIINGEPVEEGMDLGVTGFESCHITKNEKLVEASGVTIVNESNHNDFSY